MDNIEKNLLKTIADIEKTPMGAYNIRANGKGIERKTTENIDIITKQDKPGIDIIIKENTKNESIHIPVVLTQSGLSDMVYNDFYIGKNADVVIVAGCGIHNDHHKDSQHDGIHRFFLEEGAKVIIRLYINLAEKQFDENAKDIEEARRLINDNLSSIDSIIKSNIDVDYNIDYSSMQYFCETNGNSTK